MSDERWEVRGRGLFAGLLPQSHCSQLTWGLAAASLLALIAWPTLGDLWPAVVLGGAWFTVALCRRAAPHDRGLLSLALAAYGLRAVLAAGLYGVSLLRGGHGFWSFAPDAAGYSGSALSIVRAWHDGQPSPDVFPATPFLLVIAAVYSVVGPVPLALTALNGWLASFAVVQAYLVGRRLRDPLAGRLAAAAMGCFPSSVLWSTQLLKDAAAQALALLVLQHLMALWQERVARPASCGASAAALLLRLGAAGFSLGLLRSYVGWALTGASLALVPWALIAAVERGTSNVDRQRAHPTFNVRRLAFTVTTLGASATLGLAIAASVLCQNLLSRELRARYIAAAVPIKLQAVNPERELTARAMPVVEPIVNPLTDLFVNLSPEVLQQHYNDIARAAGGVGQPANVSTRRRLLSYAPYAVARALLAPFPNEWLEQRGPSSRGKLLAAGEMVLIYLLVPSMVVGAVLGLRARPAETSLLLAYALAVALPLGVAIATTGTLFRLRATFLPALLVIACAWGRGGVGPVRLRPPPSATVEA